MSAYQPVNLLLYPDALGPENVVESQTVKQITVGTSVLLGDFSIYRSRFLKVDNATDQPVTIDVGKPANLPTSFDADTGVFSTLVKYGSIVVLPGDSVIVEKDPGSSKGIRAVYSEDDGVTVADPQDPNVTDSVVLTPATLEPNLNALGDIVNVSSTAGTGTVYVYPVAISG